MAEAKSKKPAAKKSGSGSSSKAKADSGARSALNGAAPVLEKAKLPLLAAGAAAAGIAGTVLASKAGGRHKVLGVSVPKRSRLSLPKRNGFKPDARKMTKAVTDAAKRADDFGQGMSRIASSVKKAGEAADEAVKKS